MIDDSLNHHCWLFFFLACLQGAMMPLEQLQVAKVCLSAFIAFDQTIQCGQV